MWNYCRHMSRWGWLLPHPHSIFHRPEEDDTERDLPQATAKIYGCVESLFITHPRAKLWKMVTPNQTFTISFEAGSIGRTLIHNVKANKYNCKTETCSRNFANITIFLLVIYLIYLLGNIQQSQFSNPICFLWERRKSLIT